MPLQRNRPPVIRDGKQVQLSCQLHGVSDGGRKAHDLGTGAEGLEAGDKPSKAVSPVGVAEHVDLIDDHAADVADGNSRPQYIVKRLVRCNDNICPNVCIDNHGVVGRLDA